MIRIGKAALIKQALPFAWPDPPRTGSPKPTSASSTAWPRRMLVSSLDLANNGTCVAAPTTAAPTMCHIDATGSPHR